MITNELRSAPSSSHVFSLHCMHVQAVRTGKAHRLLLCNLAYPRDALLLIAPKRLSCQPLLLDMPAQYCAILQCCIEALACMVHQQIAHGSCNATLSLLLKLPQCCGHVAIRSVTVLFDRVPSNNAAESGLHILDGQHLDAVQPV